MCSIRLSGEIRRIEGPRLALPDMATVLVIIADKERAGTERGTHHSIKKDWECSLSCD